MKTNLRSRATGPLSGSRRSPTDVHTTATASPNHQPDDELIIERAADPATLPRRRLSPSDFNSAMIHFYRGEVQRSNTWRNRLDTTTNWAVLTAGATLSFAFGQPQNPHFVIIINSLLVAFFLFMEARRYRYYEIWSSRVRVLETGYFAQLLAPEKAADNEWAGILASDLLTPHFTISEWEALGRRLRRNYLWLFVLLAASWNLKIYLHPEPAVDFDEFISRAAVGLLPGRAVFIIGIIFNAALLIFALATVRLREATGEVLPRHQSPLETIRRVTDWTRATAQHRRTMVRRTKRARARARVGSATGEWKKPAKEPIKEESLT